MLYEKIGELSKSLCDFAFAKKLNPTAEVNRNRNIEEAIGRIKQNMGEQWHGKGLGDILLGCNKGA
jgi:hypothetical protein